MVDPSSRSLNQISESLGKAEALNALVSDILQEAKQSSNSLIPKAEKTLPAGEISPPKAKTSGHPKKMRRRRRQDKVDSPAKRKATRPVREALPVSPGLFYRYNRQEIYKKVWELPMGQVAKEYGLSSDTFRKTCERLWIPLPRRAYLAMKSANKPVAPPPPLPVVKVIREKRKTSRTRS